MSSVAFQLIEGVTEHVQNDSLEDAREICADGAYFPNNLRICYCEAWPHQRYNVFGKLIVEPKEINTASVRGPLRLHTRHRVIESVLNVVFRVVQ